MLQEFDRRELPEKAYQYFTKITELPTPKVLLPWPNACGLPFVRCKNPRPGSP